MSEAGVPGVTAEVEEPQQQGGGRRMVLNMGPQHPSTHGVLRLLMELDGETIITCKPDIGFLHTGIEKEFEVKNYQQAVTLTDRVDYLAPLSNNLCYCLAVEQLLQLEIPSQAQWMRVMLSELTRLNSHLVWLGTHALDIGAMTVFLSGEREDILKIRDVQRPAHDDQLLPYRRIGASCRADGTRASSSSTYSPAASTSTRTC
jgi:NADH-quinone oxidoreductase subunit D